MTDTAPSDMRWIPDAAFTMGSDRFYPEEAPTRRVRVEGFWIDETPVTNRQFAAFVAATGHVTLAEIAPDPADYPGLEPADAHAGSLVFHRTRGPVDLSDPSHWWSFIDGADWRHPTGPDSGLDGLEDHPVVHVVHADAAAYAAWAGKILPSEADWELAARGGLDGADYAWGDELAPDGAMLANYWQGAFPFADLLLDGWERTSPARSYPANGYGVFDMIGNVWELTDDWWSDRPSARKCCAPSVKAMRESRDPDDPNPLTPRRVIKGGSHLCAANYCQRYRPAARHPQAIDSSTGHIGFRCILRPPRRWR